MDAQPSARVTTLARLAAGALGKPAWQRRSGAENDDNASVATSRVSYTNTKHADLRVQERSVSQQEIRACLKHGRLVSNSRNALRITHGNVVVITTAQKRIVTAWRCAATMDARLTSLYGIAQRWAWRKLKQREHAFNAWRYFPRCKRRHARWILIKFRPGRGVGATDGNDLTLMIRAWRLFVDMRHAARVDAMLRSGHKEAARALTAQRACFAHWRTSGRTIGLPHRRRQLQRSMCAWTAAVARAARFREALALIPRYRAAYSRCRQRRALRAWRTRVS